MELGGLVGWLVGWLVGARAGVQCSAATVRPMARVRGRVLLLVFGGAAFSRGKALVPLRSWVVSDEAVRFF